MRLRLFERVRRLAHARGGWDRPRRDRAGEARRERGWGARSRNHPGDPRAQVVPAGPEAGRHRREGRGAAGSAAHGTDTGGAGPPWPDAPRNDPPGGGAPRGGALTGNGSSRGGAGRIARRDSEAPAASVGGARARVRRGPYGTAPVAPPPAPPAGRARRGARAVQDGAAGQQWYEAERGYLPTPRQPSAGQRAGGGGTAVRLPFAHAHPPGRPSIGDGRRNCGSLESVLWRQWDADQPPPPEAALAIDRLAELPQTIKDVLVGGLDGIFVGPGGVPQLDDMTALRGVPLPSGRATWDACAGAYGERKIVVGTRPSPTPDVMCHEIGHALDDLDSPSGAKWQSDSAEFRMLYDQCQPHLASDFHRQRGGLGRKEFFADAFAAIASRQRPALVDMLGGNTRTALNVMLYFNRRYGI
jgi:hypothetical protein